MASFVANNESDLNADLAFGGNTTITLGASFTLTSDITPIDKFGSSFTINGAGFTISGADQFHGFFVSHGTVAISNLTLSHTRAAGGNASGAYFTGGGGAGFGGGLFVGSYGAVVRLSGVSFASDSAVGGNGGAYQMGGAGNSAGAGLGGSGGLPNYIGGGSSEGYTTGGTGGFGGGGGGGRPGGPGGFGGGGGAFNAPGGFGGGGGGFYRGGGGLGAGGAVFVRQGGQLSIGAGSIAGGSVAGGNGASAFGAGIFIQGSQTITLAPGTGQTLSIASEIADQSGSGGIDANAGAGALTVASGRVVLGAANSFTGGTAIGVGATLALGITGAAGSGDIRFAPGATLALAAGVTLANQLDTIQPFDVIDVAGITGATAVLSGTTLTIAGTGGSVALTLDSSAYLANAFVPASDGHGGTIVTYTTAFIAHDVDELNADIAAVNAFTQPATIVLANAFSLSANITPITLSPGGGLVIDGGGFTLDGDDQYHGFFVAAGNVTIENVTVSHTRSIGGNAGRAEFPGGGGAGLGGGLFVGANGTVTLLGASFTGGSAIGGSGGDGYRGFSSNGGALGGSGGLAAYAGGKIAYTGFYTPTYGGSGGFGGGGAGGSPRAGNGGFGGGGGGIVGNAGFGGGGGTTLFGGGGLGAGGAIFVREGGKLTLGAGSVSGNSVQPGSAGTYGGVPSNPIFNGSAFGAGMFLQGDQTITLAPGTGQTLSIGDAIADEAGSGGTGAGALALTGHGRVALTAASTFTGGVSIGTGATLALGATAAAGTGHIRFAQGATLAVAASVTVGNPLDSISFGDVIDLAGITGASTVLNGSTLTVSGTGGSIALHLDSAAYQASAFALATDGHGGTAITYTACYAAGTRIATPQGEVAVERLRVGDLVRLAGGGTAPVQWLGHRSVDCRRHPRPQDVLPVRVQADTFAPGQPARDLVLSPDHAVFTDGVLVPIRYLLNGATIRQEHAASIDYWHVELPEHGILLAENLPAESYLDTGNRAAFANGGAAVMAHPDFARAAWARAGAAPLLLHGTRLVAIAQALVERAERLGHWVTADPAPLLAVGAVLLAPQPHGAGWRWPLPAGSSGIARLRSRSIVPAQLRPGEADHRRLGIAVARILLDGRAIDLAAPGAGWHDAEPDWRWTDGDAAIPLGDARELVVIPAMTELYWEAA